MTVDRFSVTVTVKFRMTVNKFSVTVTVKFRVTVNRQLYGL